jgi:tetratricopeptide (TPR) repeat protein
VKRAFWPLFLLIFAIGCATTAPTRGPKPAATIRNVPFIAQKPNYCGPAALASIAQFYGLRVSQDDVANTIYLPEIEGTLTFELADFARRAGFWARQYRGSLDDVRQKIAFGVPLIVLGKFNDNYHYFIVFGFDDNREVVHAHSDTRKNLSISYKKFEETWTRANHWTLLACPPQAARWRLSAIEHNSLGIFYEQRGWLDDARAHFSRAAALEPQNPRFIFNMGNTYLGEQKFETAARFYRRVLELDAQDADAMNNLAYAFAALGENLDEAAALAKKAAELAPEKRAYALDTLGLVRFQQGKFAEAIRIFEDARAATAERDTELRRMIDEHLAAARAALK